MTDYIRRADAIEAVRGLSVLVDDEDFYYFEDALKALPSAKYITEKPNDAIKPSNDVINRADAIDAVAEEWLSEASAESPYVNDYDIDKYRELAEDLFSDIPSADAVGVCKSHEEEHLNITNRIKELQYEIAKTQTIVGKLVESAEAESKRVLQGYNKGANTIQTIRHEELQSIANTRKAVESADAVHGWRIGKPTEQGKYMVTIDSFGHKRIDLFYYGKPMMPNRKVRGKCWYRSDDEWGDVVYDDTDILAWQPLPKPYREESEVEE
jgi:hypothetical protein